MTDGLSAADVALLSGNGRNNDGFGDGNGWWVLLFLLCWGGGWGGFGGGFGGMGGGYPTEAILQRSLDTQTIIGKLDGINQGICDGFYAQNTTLMNGFHGVDNAICNLGYQTQQGFNQTNIALMQGQNALQTQLSDCCCQTQRAIDGVNYNMATNTCNVLNTMNTNTRDIIDSQNAGTRAILDYLCQEKISDLQQENQTLKLAASQAEQNNFIAANQSAQTAELIRRLGADCPTPAYVVQPPQPVTFPTNCCGQFNGYNNGYGNCGNGCGGCGSC